MRLREGAKIHERPEIEAAALQYVRKVSGFRAPAPHNREAFDEAVRRIADATDELLESLVIKGT